VQYPALKKYTIPNGLASYNVKKIIRDHNDLTWIGTQAGLSRFDSRNFLTYTPNSSAGTRIAGSDIRGIIEDTSKNMIWTIATEGGFNGIDMNTGRVIQRVSIPYKEPECFSLSMALAGNYLWIGSLDGVKLYNTNKSKFEPDPEPPYSKSSGKSELEVNEIFSDHLGNIWVCYYGYGIVIYDTKTQKIVKKISLEGQSGENNYTKVNDHLFRTTNELLLATNHGLRKIRFTPTYDVEIIKDPCVSLQAFNSESLQSIEAGPENSIFIAGLAGFFCFSEDFRSYTHFIERASDESNWLNSIHYIYNDKKGNIWLGCQQGLAVFSTMPNAFTSFYDDKKTGNKLEHVRSIYVADSSTLLVGLMNGLARVSKTTGAINIYDSSRTYFHVFKDPFGKILVSRDDGMFCYKNNTVAPIAEVYPRFANHANKSTNSHIQIGDSILVMGTENEKGILVWNYKRDIVEEITRKSGGRSLASDVVNNLYKDKSGNIWVLSDKSFTILDQYLSRAESFSVYDTVKQGPAIFYFDMCEWKGDYWVASYESGIIQLDSNYNTKRILGPNEGLSDHGVYQLFPYGDILMVTTNNGLSCYSSKTGKFRNYYQVEGLHSNSFEEVAGVAGNGMIYAGGVKGFTEINPANFRAGLFGPKIFIDKIQVKTTSGKIDTSDYLLRSLTIPNNVLQTTLYFLAVNYGNPEQTVIVYRIREQGEEWITVENNTLPLIGFRHGTYHLEVKAANEDGVWSEPIQFTLIFLPKWYQQWWFKALLGLIVAGIVYTIYRIRIHQLKKEERIRARLASDLHDDLGSTFNSIKVYSNLALMQPGNKDYLFKVKEGTQDAINGIRDMIWVLDDKKDTLGDLLSRVKQFAVPLCEAGQVQFITDVSSSLYHHKLGKEEKRNLYLIMKEVINNCIKYAECGSVSLSMQMMGRRLAITISDNGKGFDTATVKEGNGLKNIVTRANEIGYKHIIASIPGKGTELRFEKH
jgi:ligand-binding sensor domain-containing protein